MTEICKKLKKKLQVHTPKWYDKWSPTRSKQT